MFFTALEKLVSIESCDDCLAADITEAAILTSLTPPPREGEAVGAAESTGLSSACFLFCLIARLISVQPDSALRAELMVVLHQKANPEKR